MATSRFLLLLSLVAVGAVLGFPHLRDLIPSFAADPPAAGNPIFKIGSRGDGSNAKGAILLILPAREVPASAYTPLAEFLQNATHDSLNLWYYISASNIQNLKDFENLYDIVQSNFVHNGLQSGAPVYVIANGFSAGVIRDFSSRNSRIPVQKLAVLGGSLLMKNDVSVISDLPPTITIGGELDGVVRLTRMAQQFYLLQKADLLNKYPTVVLEKLSYSSFFDGAIPNWIQTADLKAEISQQEARALYAPLISEFFSSSAISTGMKSLMESTGILVDPLVKALQYEGSYKIGKPCFEVSLTTDPILEPNRKDCLASSPFISIRAQQIMSGKSVTVNNVDRIWPLDLFYPSDYLPNITEVTCSASRQCTLSTQTVSELHFDTIDENESSGPVSAREMAVKFTSRQKTLLTVNPSASGSQIYDTESKESYCKDMNEDAYKWAVENAAEKARVRYQKSGSPLRMVDDYLTPAGFYPYWSLKYLQFQRTLSGAKAPVDVLSTSLLYKADFFITHSAGLHFCKLLSPARVMEWIYIDSLRTFESSPYS